MSCKADCFIDTGCGHQCLRPLSAPGQLVWGYFNVHGAPSGQLETRQYTQCECGCGNLIANPPAHINNHNSLQRIQ